MPLRAMSFISRLRRSRQHRVSIRSAYLVHPFPLRGTSPQGEMRALRDWLSVSYGMIRMLVISRYAAPPYPAAPDFPLCRGQNKTPRIILFISGALLSPAAGGIGIYMMAPRAPYLPSGTVLHTSRGRSPQPVREASAGPGQNPGSPGPKARRLAQPSRP